MGSIDALANAIKEFPGGVVIVSHDFRALVHSYSVVPLLTLGMFVIYLGLISQVADDLWEVKNKTIRNLSRDGIDIKAYKAGLVKQSASFQFRPLFIPDHFVLPRCIPGMKQIEKLKAKKGSMV